MRNRTNRMYRERYKEIYHEGLVQEILETEGSHCLALPAGGPGEPGELMVLVPAESEGPRTRSDGV